MKKELCAELHKKEERAELVNVLLSLRQLKYEENVRETRMSYDDWLNHVCLVESEGNVETVSKPDHGSKRLLNEMVTVLSNLSDSLTKYEAISANFPANQTLFSYQSGLQVKRSKRRMTAGEEYNCKPAKRMLIDKTQVDGDPGDSSADENDLNNSDVSFQVANDSSDSDENFSVAQSYADELNDDAGPSDEVKYVLSPILPIFYKDKKVPVQAVLNQSIPNRKCSSWCTENCEINVVNWSTSDVAKIRELFSGVKAVQLKNKLLTLLSYQQATGLPTNGFFFNKQLLCVNYFCHLSEISKYHANLVLDDFSKGYRKYEHGNVSKSGCTAKSVTFICWMMRYIENFGQNGPTDIVIVIPSYLNKIDLYKTYIQEAPTPHCRYTTFCRFMKKFFGPRRDDKSLPWVRISKVSTHSKCECCLGLDMYRRTCKTPAEFEYCKALTDLHMNKYGNARIAVGNYIQRSISSPKQVLSLQIDREAFQIK